MPPRPPLKVVGRRLDPDDYRLRDFFARTAQPHDFFEAGTPQADAVLAEAGARGRGAARGRGRRHRSRGRDHRGPRRRLGRARTSRSEALRPLHRGRGTGRPRGGGVRGLGRAVHGRGRGGRAWRPGVLHVGDRELLRLRRPHRRGRARTARRPSGGALRRRAPAAQRRGARPPAARGDAERGAGERRRAHLRHRDRRARDGVAPARAGRRRGAAGPRCVLRRGTQRGHPVRGRARGRGGRRQLGGPGRDEPGERRRAGDPGGARRQSRQVDVGAISSTGSGRRI